MHKAMFGSLNEKDEGELLRDEFEKKVEKSFKKLR